MITISLCLIVRNEEAVLGRCLDSFKDIADEIIIVDTGSSDMTKDIASLYTNLIFDFEWVDDFSAARNYSFSRASMEYIMWVDADDIINDIEKQKLINWKLSQTKNKSADIMSSEATPDVVMLKYATAFDDNGFPTFQYYRERLLRRDCNFKWKGRVHEAIAPSGKIDYLDIYLEHHSNKTSYSDRNLKIYEKMKDSGDKFNSRDRFYYARELYYHGKYTESIDNLDIFLNMPNSFVENQLEACRIAAYCCYSLNLPTKALQYLFKALTYRVPSGELCCDIGKHFLDRQQYEEAIFWYSSALRTPKKTENGGFILEECYGYLPCIQLSICYDKIGDWVNALLYHKKAGEFNPLGELYLKNCSYFYGNK